MMTAAAAAADGTLPDKVAALGKAVHAKGQFGLNVVVDEGVDGGPVFPTRQRAGHGGGRAAVQ